MSDFSKCWYEFMWWKNVEGRQQYEYRAYKFDVINCSIVVLDWYVGCTSYPDRNIGSSNAFYIALTRVGVFKLSYII